MEGLITDHKELLTKVREGVPFGELIRTCSSNVSLAALNHCARARVPMIDAESDFATSKPIARLKEYLSAIGAKLAPGMQPKAASAWIDALCMSLGKWPPSVAIEAAKQARHEPIPHGINGVDEVLHRLAAEYDSRQRQTITILQTLHREILNAMKTENRIEDRSEEWTQESIDEANALFRRIGARTRYELVDGKCVSNFKPLFTIEDAQRETAEFDNSKKDSHIPKHGGNHEEE